MTVPVDAFLREYACLPEPLGEDAELRALRTAVLIEDVFGVTLSDEQLDPAVLGDPGALRALLAGATTTPG